MLLKLHWPVTYMHLQKTLDAIDKYVLYLTLFLLPLGFLPLFSNSFITAKLLILVIGVSIILIIKALKLISKGSIELAIGSYNFPVLLLGLTYLVSTYLRTPNKMEAFFLNLAKSLEKDIFTS